MLTDHYHAFDIVLQDNEDTKQIRTNTYYYLPVISSMWLSIHSLICSFNIYLTCVIA